MIFPCGSTGMLSLQCRPGFNPWVGKIPWRRERLHIPVFWPGEFHGLYTDKMSLKSRQAFLIILTDNVYWVCRDNNLDLNLYFFSFFFFLDNWSAKAKRRNTTGTGRMRHLKIVYRRFRYSFYVSVIGGCMGLYNKSSQLPWFVGWGVVRILFLLPP